VITRPTVVLTGVGVAALGCVDVVAVGRVDVVAVGCVDVVAVGRAGRRLPPVRASAGIAQASSPPLSSAARAVTATARREAMASARKISSR
jgi:hypothetical protein